MSALKGWSRSKWRIRKQGRWQVWRPNESEAIASFDTYEDVLQWQPDCDRFLQGYCGCRGECAR